MDPKDNICRAIQSKEPTSAIISHPACTFSNIEGPLLSEVAPVIPSDFKKTHRFNISLPVQLTRAGERQVSQALTTQNVSAKSVLMSSPTCLVEIGQEVEYIVTLPSRVAGAAVRLWCHGRVIHSDPLRNALSVSIERHEFVCAEAARQGA